MPLFAELRQRNVFKVGMAYAVVSWLIIQVVDTIAPSLHLPLWTTTLVTVLLLIGFPVALLLAWAFELTPEGIKPTRQVDRSVSVTRETGRKLDFIIIGILVVALAYFVADKHLLSPGEVQVETTSAIAASGQSIAVLPFENRSEIDSDRFFTDGIHDDLLTQISRIPDIKTISRTSVLAYRDTNMNMRQIGEELGVATLLEGGVQRAGDQVRINVQLIDVATDAHLWAETYTRKMTAENIFAIQTEITLAIADALRSVLSPETRQQLEEDIPTSNLAALEAYFRGRMQFGLATSEGYDLAIAEFERAVTEDERFALAHAWLANAYLLQVYYSGRSVDQQLALARPHVDRAMALDPDLPEAWSALANMHRNSGNLDEADRAHERTIKLDPNNAIGYQHYGNFQRWVVWDLAEAERLFAKAAELDPKNPHIAKEHAESLLAVGEVESAVAMLERLMREHPEIPGVYHDMGTYKAQHRNRYDEAVALYRKACQLDPLNPAIARSLAFAYRRLGDPDASAVWSERAAALAPNGEDAVFHLGYAAFVRGDLATARSYFSRVSDVSSMHPLSMRFLQVIDLDRGQAEAWANYWSEAWNSFEDENKNARFRALLSAWPIEALVAAGRHDEARQMADEVLPVLEQLPRKNVVGSGLVNARIHYALGNREAAIVAIRDYVEAGGATYLMINEALYPDLRNDLEYARLLGIVEQRLAEQRANLAVMEANGKLAPIPPLPDS